MTWQIENIFQTNNEGGGELHEVKRSGDKTEIGKEII